MTTAEELRDRWRGPEGLRLRVPILAWLRGDAARPPGLGEIEGRVDLRGIALTASPVTLGEQDAPGSGVRWESLDLRGAQLDGIRFFGARVVDCLFDSCSVVDFRLWGCEVIDCSFRRARISGALGSGEWKGHRNIWRRVAFEGADLRGAVFTGCVIEECSFERNSSRLLLEDCEVRSSTFRGEFESLLISGLRHHWPVYPSDFSADFSQATFVDSHIVGYTLDRTQLPKQGDLIVLRNYPRRVAKAIAWLSENASTIEDHTARNILEMWNQPAGVDDTDLCFDLRGVDPGVAHSVRRALE